MAMFTVLSTGTERTCDIAAVLARQLRAGDVILLDGGLATGKTTFVKAIAAELSSPDSVTSPTFALAHFYGSRAGQILHIDAYRLSGIPEFRDLGLDDYIDESITLVEWGSKLADDFDCNLTIVLSVDPGNADCRTIKFSSDCDRWTEVFDLLYEQLDRELRVQ